MVEFNNTTSDRRTGDDGFSLIEVAIAMIVIGVLLAAALQMYNQYAQNKITLQIRSNLQTVETALQRYVYRYGHYPRPAPRNAALGTATVGREIAAVIPPAVYPACPPATAGDVCITNANVYNSPAPTDNVLIGDIPFATLGIKYNSTLDPWGGKLVYAVTENLTNTATYNDSWGAINVNGLNGAVVQSVFNAGIQRAHFFVFSTGPDRRGAFGQGGTQIAACGTVALNGRDAENCNLDGLFQSNENLTTAEKKVLVFDAPGAQHFDDHIAYANSTSNGIWTRTAASTTGQIDINSTNPQNIKIGPLPANGDATCKAECNAGCTATYPPGPLRTACNTKCNNCASLPRTKLDIEGTVRANQLNTDRWCYDYSATGCVANNASPIPSGILAPRTLGGVPVTSGAYNNTYNRNNGGGILCSGDMAMRGIFQGDEVCAYTSRFNAIGTLGAGCAAGHYAIGRKSDGSWCCDDDATCNAGWAP